MALDPTIQALIDQAASQPRPRPSSMTPEEVRNAYVLMSALSGPPADLAATEDRHIPGPAGGLRVRCYRPHGDDPLGVVVYFHGGGWTIGSIDTHDLPCQQLAAQSGCVVVSVDYRLAPENPFPAAIEDCLAATRWVHQFAADLGADGDRLAVAGDSAGGNLATVVCHLAKDAGGPPIRFQALIYPATDASMAYPSVEENGEVPFLSRDTMEWFWRNYISAEEERLSPLASPLLRSDLSGLPPALIITGEHDALRDEGEAYARRLEEAGVPVRCTRYPGMPHAFFQMAGIVEGGRRAVTEVASALAEALSPGEPA